MPSSKPTTNWPAAFIATAGLIGLPAGSTANSAPRAVPAASKACPKTWSFAPSNVSQARTKSPAPSIAAEGWVESAAGETLNSGPTRVSVAPEKL